MGAARKTRVFVGLDGSMGSLRALRQAVTEARERGAELYAIHVRRPTPSAPYQIPTEAEARRHADRQDRQDRQAKNLIVTCLDEALGGPPLDIVVHRSVKSGSARKVLVSLGCRDDDLIVVGTRPHRLTRGWFRRSVSRYCVSHARCPVLAVPPDNFARAINRRARPIGPLRRRSLWKELESLNTTGSQHVT